MHEVQPYVLRDCSTQLSDHRGWDGAYLLRMWRETSYQQRTL